MTNDIRILAEARRRRRKKAQEQEFAERVAALVKVPEVKDGAQGRDGRDAPTMEEILERVKDLLPETKIIQQEVIQDIDEKRIKRLIQEELPEPQSPQIQVIREELKLDTSEFVTKEQLDKVLKRIDQAIRGVRGGGNYQDLLQRVETLEELQAPFTADNTVVTADSTQRTADEI